MLTRFLLETDYGGIIRHFFKVCLKSDNEIFILWGNVKINFIMENDV